MDQLNDKQKWLYDWCAQGNPTYIESRTMVRKYHLKFFSDRKVKDKNIVGGWNRYYQIDKTRKDISARLGELIKKGFLKKQAYGIHDHIDAGLGRNWVWAYTLTAKEPTNDK